MLKKQGACAAILNFFINNVSHRNALKSVGSFVHRNLSLLPGPAEMEIGAMHPVNARIFLVAYMKSFFGGSQGLT